MALYHVCELGIGRTYQTSSKNVYKEIQNDEISISSRNVHKHPEISEAFYAECMRAVAALAVAGLGYYCAADGPRSIWSAGLGRNGSFSNSAHN